MTPLGPPPSPRPGPAHPRVLSTCWWVEGWGCGWKQRANNVTVILKPLLDKINAGFPRVLRLLRKQRLANPGVEGLEGGGEREISRGSGIPSRCWGGVGRGGLPLES